MRITNYNRWLYKSAFFLVSCCLELRHMRTLISYLKLYTSDHSPALDIGGYCKESENLLQQSRLYVFQRSFFVNCHWFMVVLFIIAGIINVIVYPVISPHQHVSGMSFQNKPVFQFITGRTLKSIRVRKTINRLLRCLRSVHRKNVFNRGLCCFT